MKRSNCYFLIARDIGRQISDDDWEVLEPFHIASWQSIERILQNQQLSLDGSTFRLMPDFRQGIDRLVHRYSLMQRIFHEKDNSAMSEFTYNEIFLRLVFEEDGMAEGLFSRSEDIAEYIIFEIFIILNTAAPGCCDLSNATLVSHPRHLNIYGQHIDTSINLSGRVFEAALYEPQDHPWMIIEKLSVEDVSEWINVVCPRFTVRPSNPGAKAIFALQHLARSEQGPTSIIWIFYGLESLYQCKPGENFRTLVERISLFLELNEDAKSALRKRLRELYDLRSAFVHGGHRVAHPLYNGLFGEEDESNSYRYVRDSDFGAAVLIMSIQRLVKLKWSYPIFREVMTGHSAAASTEGH
jgi:hypothetical protein